MKIIRRFTPGLLLLFVVLRVVCQDNDSITTFDAGTHTLKEFYNFIKRANTNRLRITRFGGNVVQLKLLTDSLWNFTGLNSLYIRSTINDTPWSDNMDKQLAKMNHLEKIELDSVNNPEWDATFNSLCKLTSLKYINIGPSQISSVPNEIAKLRDLEELTIEEGHVSAISDSISTLPGLIYINLAQNSLHAFPVILLSINSLVGIDLSGNKISYIPHSIGKMSRLSVLACNNCNLRNIPPELFCPAIIDISLANNKISSMPKSIIRTRHLTTLDLSENKIHHLPQNLIHLKNYHLTYRNYNRNKDSLSNTSLAQIDTFFEDNLKVTEKDVRKEITMIRLYGNKIKCLPEVLLKKQILVSLELDEENLNKRQRNTVTKTLHNR